MDGAHSEVCEDETAFGGSRKPGYWVFIVAVTPDPDLLDADRAWVRATWDALQPFAMNTGGYVNGQAEYPSDRVRAIYGAKFDRLARIKAGYDLPMTRTTSSTTTPTSSRPSERPRPGARSSTIIGCSHR